MSEPAPTEPSITATLTFPLPEYRYEHLCAVHGQRFVHALSEIQENLRQYHKHGPRTVAATAKLLGTINEIVRDELILLEDV